MTPHRFKLAGGDPALDFLNTVHDWTSAAPRDYLPRFDDAVRFGRAAGVLSDDEAAAVRRRPPGRELAELLAARALLERIFRAVATGTRPAEADLDRLTRVAAQAAGVARLRGGGRGRDGAMVRRTLEVDRAGAAILRFRIAEAAVSLLTGGRLERVKACPSCGWFFLDASKNGSRRWCSMATCGSSAKAKRYYWRNKGGS